MTLEERLRLWAQQANDIIAAIDSAVSHEELSTLARDRLEVARNLISDSRYELLMLRVRMEAVRDQV